MRARKHRRPAISQSRGNRGPMLERDLVPVPLQHQAGTETAASLARSISGSETTSAKPSKPSTPRQRRVRARVSQLGTGRLIPLTVDGLIYASSLASGGA